MKIRIALSLAVAGVAALLAAQATAIPPPLKVRLAVTNVRPIAGKTFTGITVINLQSQIMGMVCEATVGHKVLEGRVHRFYAPGAPAPAALTCSWHIPAGSKGKLLRLTKDFISASGNSSFPAGQAAPWRIR
jgi:hypothetical protein